MTDRKVLERSYILTLGEHEYHIEELAGQGFNAVVYKAWYYDGLNTEQKHHVLIKELFPYHAGGKIYRGDDKRVIVMPEAERHWEKHRRSFETGNAIHLRLLAEQPELMALGANINTYEHNGTLYTVLGYSGGRSLQEELNSKNSSLRVTARRMILLLDALEAFHGSGYLHLDISPSNVMLVGKENRENIFLIDYNSARPLCAQGQFYLSCKKGYSAPELVIRNQRLLGYETDLYSVAAVFYRCVMGKKPSNLELSNLDAAFAANPLLKDHHQTVLSMVREIMQKGLKDLREMRYRNISEMRQAFQELIDRIDNLGVTHASLWENGRRSVDELISTNPALRYLNDEKQMYPIRLEAGESLSLSSYLSRLSSGEASSGLVLAQGGMGKTTLLLHTARILGRQYSHDKPAVFYISLSGWKGGDTQYIRRQILLRLHYKKGENDYDGAMHTLHELMNRPLNAVGTPAIVLLLDGLNEIRDETAPLIQEINELEAMAGVKVLAASRSECDGLNLETVRLMPLNTEDVETALAGQGLLMPRNYDVLELLRTPLILSMFIQASEGGKQLDVDSREELMQAYMDALLEKELRVLPENSPERWQLACALKYVLPAIAAGVKKNGETLTRQQLLKVVENCWRMLRPKSTRNLIFEHSQYSEWIGHSKDIFAGAKNADEWFKIIIDQLLWQKLGMLSKESDAGFRIFHQSVCDYLDAIYFDIAKKTWEKQRKATIIWSVLSVLFFVLVVLFGVWDDYRFDLCLDIERPLYDYYDCREWSEPYFVDAIELLKAYVEEPDGPNAQNASIAIQSAANSLSSDLEWRDFYRQSSERFDPETGKTQYSNFDKLALRCIKKPVEKLSYLEKRYLYDEKIGTYGQQIFGDYFELLFTLDALIWYQQDTDEALPMVSEYLSAMSEFVTLKREMLELLYAVYQHFPTQSDLSDLPEMDEKLTQLAAELARIGEMLPQEVREKNEERISLFLETGVFHSLAPELRHLPALPYGWEPPEWLPEDVGGVYLCLDETSGEIRELTGESDINPFAWRAVCYDVPREDVQSYAENYSKKLIEQGGGYWYNYDEERFQALLLQGARNITIVWKNGITELTVSGLLLG